MGIVSTVNGSTDNTKIPTTSTSTGSSQELQDNFMKLLITQLKHQDPTNPMDNSQLTSQLAQISTLNGIEKLNTSLGTISGQIDNSVSIQASNMIGHAVMVPGNTILVSKDSDGAVVTTPLGVELESLANDVTVTISDARGNNVTTLDVGSLSAGVHSFAWDGLLSDGSNAPDGSYQFTIKAKNGDSTVNSTALNYAQVYGVINSSNSKSVMLDLGLMGTASVADVRQILN